MTTPQWVPFSPEGYTFVRRIEDGTLYVASYPTYDELALGIFSENDHTHFFRRVQLVPKRWWQTGPRFVWTGEVWETSNDSAWEVAIVA